MYRFHHLVGCHATGTKSLLIYFLHALSCFYLLHQVIYAYHIYYIKPNMNDSLRIIVIKINIIQICSNKTYIITKKYNKIRVYIIKLDIIIREYNIIKFFKHFIMRIQSGINFNVGKKNQQLYHTFLDSSRSIKAII